jgi:SnoaL-like domain
VLDWAGGIVEGRAAIRAEAAGMKASMAQVFGEGTMVRHFLTHSAISVDGDRASVRAGWFEAMCDGIGAVPRIGTFGHYADELARINGRWLFRRRKIFNEFLAGRGAGAANPVAMMEAMP